MTKNYVIQAVFHVNIYINRRFKVENKCKFSVRCKNKHYCFTMIYVFKYKIKV